MKITRILTNNCMNSDAKLRTNNRRTSSAGKVTEKLIGQVTYKVITQCGEQEFSMIKGNFRTFLSMVNLPEIIEGKRNGRNYKRSHSTPGHGGRTFKFNFPYLELSLSTSVCSPSDEFRSR